MKLREILIWFFAIIFVISTVYNIYSQLSNCTVADTLAGFYSLSVPMLVIAFWVDTKDNLARNKHIGLLVYQIFLFIYAITLFVAMIVYNASLYLMFFECAMLLVTGFVVLKGLYKILQTK